MKGMNAMLQRLAHVARLFLPSNLAEGLERRSLRRRHGLVLAGRGGRFEITRSSFGRRCRLRAPVTIEDSRLGDFTYIEAGCRICSADIGRYCSIAPDCVIGPPGHPLDAASTHPIFYLRQPRLGLDYVASSDDPSARLRTSIGHDVWIGAGVFVRRGVCIGHGAIVGAGAVVVADIAPYAIVVGVPARSIRTRFDPETVQRLLAAAWWDREENWIRRHAALFANPQALLAELEGTPAPVFPTQSVVEA